MQSSLEDVTAYTVKECGFSMTQRYTKRSPLIKPQLLSGSSQVPQERPQLFRSTVSDDADSTATKRCAGSARFPPWHIYTIPAVQVTVLGNAVSAASQSLPYLAWHSI